MALEMVILCLDVGHFPMRGVCVLTVDIASMLHLTGG